LIRDPRFRVLLPGIAVRRIISIQNLVEPFDASKRESSDLGQVQVRTLRLENLSQSRRNVGGLQVPRSDVSIWSEASILFLALLPSRFIDLGDHDEDLGSIHKGPQTGMSCSHKRGVPYTAIYLRTSITDLL
jgi:hypothetical protein